MDSLNVSVVHSIWKTSKLQGLYNFSQVAGNVGGMNEMLRHFTVSEQGRFLSASSVNLRQNMCLVPNFGIQGNEAGIHGKPANKFLCE